MKTQISKDVFLSAWLRIAIAQAPEEDRQAMAKAAGQALKSGDWSAFVNDDGEFIVSDDTTEDDLTTQLKAVAAKQRQVEPHQVTLPDSFFAQSQKNHRQRIRFESSRFAVGTMETDDDGENETFIPSENVRDVLPLLASSAKIVTVDDIQTVNGLDLMNAMRAKDGKLAINDIVGRFADIETGSIRKFAGIVAMKSHDGLSLPLFNATNDGRGRGKRTSGLGLVDDAFADLIGE